MNNDLISREDLINAKPEFMNENVVRDTKYRTAKDRIYAKAWNACNYYWLNTIKNAPTVDFPDWYKVCEDVKSTFERPQGEWIIDDGEWLTNIYPHINIDANIKIKIRCKKCGKYTIEKSNFCPNCGADMRGIEK